MGLGIASLAAPGYGAAYSVESPDGKLRATVKDGARLTFTLKADGKMAVDKRPLAVERKVSHDN